MTETEILKKIEKEIGKTIPWRDSIEYYYQSYTTNEEQQIIGIGLNHCDISSIEFILEYLSKLPALSTLYLRANEITDLKPLEICTNLTSLNLDRNHIADIGQICRLTNIEDLSIKDNNVSDIKPIRGLVNLKSLNLRGNNVVDISHIDILTKLKHLDLTDNKIISIQSLKNLNELEYLGVSNNSIVDIDSVRGLTKITYLNISNNDIIDISPIRGLNKLISLYFNGNNIEDIKPIEELNSLRSLGYQNNPIKEPPPEIVTQGIASIRKWFSASKKHLNEIKVLLVGDHTAGKTSLCTRLRKNEFNAIQNQTDGIVIETFRFGEMDTFSKNVKLRNITAYLWDFGGQEILSNTHQFFMTNRSVYLLVLEARSDRDADQQVRLWMQRILPGCGNSPVIVVVNKIELNRGFGFDTNTLRKEYPQIKEFIKISCAEGENIDAVRRALEEWIPKADFFETKIDERWITLKNELQQKTGKKHKLNHAEFIDICRNNNLWDSIEQEQAIRFLNDLGIVLHFDDLVLTEYYVLDPYWVTSGVYRIITSDLVGRLQGELEKRDLPEIVNDEAREKTLKKHLPEFIEYSPNECLYLANIMEHFQLCYYLDHNSRILIPDLLNKDTPFEQTIPFENAAEKISFLYTYTYLPVYIIPRLIVAMKDDIVTKWRSGIILKYKPKNNTQALVMSNANKNSIKIAVTGDERESKEYLAIIRYNIDKINNKHNLNPKSHIPLPNLHDEVVDYNNLLAMAAKGKTEFETFVDGEQHIFPISSLINGIYSKERNEQLVLQLVPKKLTIFLSSSFELKDERTKLEIMLARDNHEYFEQNIHVFLKIWEDMGSAVSNRSTQEEYNEELRKCDIFIMLYFSKVGIYTREEFERAYEQFMQTGKPLIYVFSKERVGNFDNQSKQEVVSLFDFEDRLNEIKHFKTRYKNTEDLVLQVKKEINRFFNQYDEIG